MVGWHWQGRFSPGILGFLFEASALNSCVLPCRSILALLRNIAVGAPNGNGGGGGGTSTRGRIVATSMHQPSPQLFAMLDTVLLMAGGRVAYFGPPAGVAAALAAAGAPPPLLYDNGHANGNALHVLTDGDKPAVHDNDSVKPVNHQPEVVAVAVAEHMLDAVSDPRVAARMCDLHAAAVAAAAAHGLPPTAPPPTYRLSAHPLPPSNPNATSHPHPYPTYATIYVTDNNAGEPSDPYVRRLVRARQEPGVVGWLRRLRLELGVLLWRCGLDLLRHPSNLALHLTVTAAVGLLVGGVFANVQNDISGKRLDAWCRYCALLESRYGFIAATGYTPDALVWAVGVLGLHRWRSTRASLQPHTTLLNPSP